MRIERFNEREEFERESIAPNSIPHYSNITGDWKQVSSVCFDLLGILIQSGKFVYSAPTSVGSDFYSWFIFDEDISGIETLLNAEAEHYSENPSEFWDMWSMDDFQGHDYSLDRLRITLNDTRNGNL
jgi:hypothetical protein